MGLLKNITSRILTGKAASAGDSSKQELLRKCYFEVMEQRRVLSADPVIAAVTFLEGDDGQDTSPDHFEVTFEGGAETTQLTQFSINGDQDLSGAQSSGDVFFDVNDQLPGTGQSHDFQFDAENSQGVDASDVQSVTVSDDGLSLIVEVTNFEAGDVFAFTIDVDEVEGQRNDTITSGIEFEGSFFEAQFVDENFVFNETNLSLDTTLNEGFEQTQVEGVFYDEFDNLFSVAEDRTGGEFDLTGDNEEGNENRSAGAIDAFDLEERPVTIEGNVFHDEDIDCVHDEGEDGIEGVEITLSRLNEETGEYEDVATTTTNAAGHYSFGEDLDIRPGTFRLTQVQPDGFLNVGEIAGSQGGTISENVIADIQIPLGGTAATDYDFKEVRPASIEGNVFHDEDNDGVFDANEQGIANVLIQVTRVRAKDGVSNDVFADTDPIFVRTDANGHYSVDLLPPGIYEVVEINNFPEDEVDPLAAFIDGRDSLGNVDGIPNGVVENDRFSEIELCPDDHGGEFNFGELLPVSIGGNVSVATPGSDPNNPNDPLRDPIEGTTIQLLDSDGNLVAETQTDANGDYEFTNLAPGTYSIVEVQPGGFLDATDHLGNVNGELRGEASQNDRFTNITLNSGDVGTDYDFCEHVPAALHGTVFHDRNDNGVQDEGEEGIEGVRITLTDADGNLVADTFTDSVGDYWFSDLLPGEYTIYEIQPDSFVDGIDTVGAVNGVTTGEILENDKFGTVVLQGGDVGVNYDFGEIQGASVSGLVHVDSNNNGVFDEGSDELLAGVTIQLLDADGSVIAETVTDDSGTYTFDGLRPGEYAVRQIQPDGLFSGAEVVGSNGGEASSNLLSSIVLTSGEEATGYDFCEHLPGELHGTVFQDGPPIETEDGLPSEGFRDIRDGIFTAGVDQGIEGVVLELYFFNTEDSLTPVQVTLADVQAEFYADLGSDLTTPITTVTNADGEYWFQGLPAGNYIVVEQQPDGFTDSNDTPGSTTGFTFNDAEEVAFAPQSLSTFSTTQLLDAISGIQIEAGGVSEFNNFSEVTFVAAQETPTPEPPTSNIPPAIPPAPLPPGNPAPPSPGLTSFPGLLGAQGVARTELVGNTRGLFEGNPQAAGGGVDSYTWHLSVINGGQPRGIGEGDSVWTQVSHLQNEDWQRFDLNDAVWTFTTTNENSGIVTETNEQARFGVIGGTPLAGDFDGDGIDELAMFRDSYWMIDVNHNGRWDDGDLLARLGDVDDRPVVGDWDGDRKDDIGIYGPMWERDLEAIERDPGLPNPDNDPNTRPKNVPPTDQDAASGARVMRLTSTGAERADVVDHVFGTGTEDEIPVTGDWNGNSIRSIGTFEAGRWNLDVNGDGRFTSEDVEVQFGTAGDIPLVGDFDGNGVEEIAIYRAGTWMIDSNGNNELDATDRTFQLGTAADTPVVGDWDGDGIDEPALYRESQVDDVL